jgi:hypothetical protein
MEVIYTYKTIDGKEFNNKTSALEHENNILQEQLNKLKSQTIISKTSLSDIKKELLAKIPEMPGVYMLVNPYDNYKKYIGSTNNLRSRYQSFLTSKVSYGGEKINQARKNTEPCKWQHIILEICNVSDLITKEAFYVDTFNSINNGYNGIIPSGSHEKSKDKNPLIAVITGMYKPNIKSKVDPDIPGKIIADIAIIATKNTYIAEPKLKLFKAIVSPPDIN